MKQIITIVVFCLLVTVPVISFAQDFDGPPRRGWGRDRHHGMHHGRRGMWFGNSEYMKEKLGLSDAQINKIAKINKQFHDKMIALREKMYPQKRELRKLIMKNSVDLKAVKKVLQQIANLEVDLRYLRILHRLELEKQLTVKQKEQLRKERRERRRRFRERRHGRMMDD